MRLAAQEIRVLLLAAAPGPRARRAEGAAGRRVGIRANAGNPQLRPDLERFCSDTFERMKKESDIKECMSN